VAVSQDDVRRIALELPHAQEMPHRRSPSFRVEMRIFCTMPNDADHIVIKLDRDDQLNMFEAWSGVVIPARHYSHHGWTYVRIDDADEPLVRTLLHLAWAHVAPRRMVKASLRAM
jgi:hypothetical protein